MSIRETNCFIHWIDFYPVDNAFYLLYNWVGLTAIGNVFGSLNISIHENVFQCKLLVS